MKRKVSLVSTVALALVLVVLAGPGGPAQAATPIYYTDRASFEAALNSMITDDYGSPPYPAGFGIYDNITFSAFLGETDYETTGFSNLNIHQANDTYCAGCNGSFRLSFQTTSFTVGGIGVYGAGVDIEGNSSSLPYYAYITYGDGTTDDIPLPVGVSFFGVTAPELIVSIHFGLSGGGSTQGGSFVIDDLTIGDQPPQQLSLGDFVWYDTNQNGIQDAGEPGVENIGVDLYVEGCVGQPIASTFTDANGNYLFTDLFPGGPYCLQFYNIPAGWFITLQDQGGDDTVDSDADPTTGQIPDIYLTDDDDTQDMGLYAEGSIGDTVFCDANYSGMYDPGEGVAGVTVSLYDDPECDTLPNTLLDTQDTVGDGQYLFTDVPAGPPAGALCYVAEVDVADMGTCDNPITPVSHPVPLSADSPDYLDADFGFSQLLSLGDLVWYDTDQNGIQDAGEPGVENIAVDLYIEGCAGQLIASTTTDANGNYLFTDLYPTGPYCLQFYNIPAGWFITLQDQSGDDTVDSDADPTTGQITDIYLTDDDDTQDMGLYAEGSIGDTVFCDANGNGSFDAGEGVAGVTVSLYDDPGCDGVAGTLLATQDTTGDGQYLFDSLPVGPPGGALCYFVEVDVADMGACDNPITPVGYAVQLDADDPDYLDADFGFSQLLSLGNLVWYDTDQDGIQDPGEPGVENIAVDLYASADCTGDVLATDTTDANGLYIFTDLQPAIHCLQFYNIPAGWFITLQDQGGDDTVDSDADPTTGQITNISVRESDLDEDMGLYAEGSIGDTVFCDANGNGSFDAGEGVAGVTVSLYDDPGCDGVAGTLLATQDTTGDGHYLFDNLPVGPPGGALCYFVEVDVADMGDCDNPITPVEYAVQLDADDPDALDADFGFTQEQVSSIGDYVWFDADIDGIQDTAEGGMAGVTVNLYDCEGTLLDTTTTNGSGYYSFMGLEAGDYNLAFVPPDGYLFTLRNRGTDDEVDSDADPTTGETACTTLDAGEDDPTWDAGFYYPEEEPEEPLVVPEASTLILLGGAATGLAGYVGLQIRARRRKAE